MTKTIVTILAFFVVSFTVQAGSHFVVNVEHYASIPFTRTEPVLILGILAMVVQAVIISLAMHRFFPNGASVFQGLTVSAGFGVFLASYIVLAEPAKYMAPSIPIWMMTETTASFIQFLIFGILLGLIFSPKQDGRPA